MEKELKMTSTVIEFITYKFKSNIDQSQIDQMNNELNTFLLEQPGFYYRSLSEDANGLQHDIIYWHDMQQAKQASEAFMQLPVCQLIMDSTVADTVNMQYMQVLSEVSTLMNEPA